MKRCIPVILGLIFWWSGIPALAAEPSSSAPATIESGKASPTQMTDAKIVRMRATGIVVEISDTTIKIERSVKETREIMDFTMEKSFPSVHPGDHVTVSYITKNGNNIALYVNPEKKYTKKRPKTADKKGTGKSAATVTPSKESSSVKK